MRYQLRMYYNDVDKNTAGSKATEDCLQILKTREYTAIDIAIYKDGTKKQNLSAAVKGIFQILKRVKSGDLICIQYPLLGINAYLSNLLKLLKILGCKVIILIHDIDSLRALNGNLKNEIARFKNADYIISHNSHMTNKLSSYINKNKIFDLDCFDYLLDSGKDELTPADIGTWSVSFAGNFNKSNFVYKLPEVQKVEFNLYGPNFQRNQLINGSKVKYHGSYPPDDLPQVLNGHFGLIWDGEEISDCTGEFGEYLRYNNPHKMSLYIVSGLPLIVPKKAAIADFVLKNKIGITITNLRELPALLANIDHNEYIVMKENIHRLQPLVKSGYFLGSVIEAIEKDVKK